MNALPTDLRHADLSLAKRDHALPCLADVLDDDRLSGLVGERVRVTRVRYKPHTSALVAFCRSRDGREDYSWAFTRAPEGVAKLCEREKASRSSGGGIRLFRPDPDRWDAVVAVGGVEDDWALRRNLLWLGDGGFERLGTLHRPGTGLLTGTTRILRYKPERRVVLIDETPEASIVIKASAHPANRDQELNFRHRLQLHGVPLLRQLGGTKCAGHGITASPAWGDGDLASLNDDNGALPAGEALARLHSVPFQTEARPASRIDGLRKQLIAASTMITALLPELEEPAAQLAGRIHSQLEQHNAHRNHVLLHGDFSADQVLVRGSAVRLIDFDRTCTGPAEADLGSFAAVEETRTIMQNMAGGSKTAQLLEGYVQAGGRFEPAIVDHWAAFRLFTSSVEPFRDRAPAWAADMSWHLDRARELIT